MANFCLVPKVAEDFKQKILDGTIDPIKLSQMTSAERHAFFSEHLGENNATPVNALFESKLLLKNQQQGMITWAKKLMGISKEAQRDLVSKIQRLDKVLSPAEQDAFLEELASQRLGVHISYEEAQKIADLSKKVDEAKKAMEQSSGVSDDERLDYGRAVVDLNTYVNELKINADKFSLSEAKKNPLGAVKKGVVELAGNAKAIKASMDNSAIFRQGWKTLLTHPGVWQKNARQTVVNLIKSFGKDEVMRELNADIVSRPTYDLMRKAKLDVGTTEEAYPTALPEKIPVVGKLYKASENAYTAFVHKTRADVFDKYIDIANRSGVELDKEQLLSIGKLVNSLTGRGSLGALERSGKTINNVFFSPKFLASNIETLTAHYASLDPKLTPFARKQAAINLLKIITATAAILAIAKALDDKSVELDPRSSDFGKIRVGDTRFDVTAGMGSLITLAEREIKQSTKSSTTGKVTPLNARDKKGNPVFGGQTGLDVIYSFFENKLSPAASVVKDLLKGQDFQGNKPTVKGELGNLAIPLPITTGIELWKNPNSAPFVVALLADALGIATNTYSPKKK